MRVSVTSGSSGRGRHHATLPFVVAALLLLLFVLLVGMASDARAGGTLTATGVQVAGRHADVQIVVTFTGPALSAAQLTATDPNPYDGAAAMLVSSSGAGTRVAASKARGVTIGLRAVPGGLSIRMAAAAGAFKYLSYALAPQPAGSTVAGEQLVIKLWRSVPVAPATKFRAHDNCLTLKLLATPKPGTLTATGAASGLFENQFRIVLRDPTGRVLASRSVSADGPWRFSLRYSAAQAEDGTFEAAAFSAKDGALICLAQTFVQLPASNARANLSVAFRAHADVNGDGRADLVRLVTALDSHSGGLTSRLVVNLAGGRQLALAMPAGAIADGLPGLVATGEVNGRKGEELFVDVQQDLSATEIVIDDEIWVITDWNGTLRVAGSLPAFGDVYGTVFGITCSARGSARLVTDHAFFLNRRTNRGTREDTVYRWSGPAPEIRRLHAATTPDRCAAAVARRRAVRPRARAVAGPFRALVERARRVPCARRTSPSGICP